MLHDVVEHILLFFFFRLLIVGFILKNTFMLVIKLVNVLFVYTVLCLQDFLLIYKIIKEYPNLV